MNVLLFAYQRPKFTEQAIQNVLAWKGLTKIFVTVDGLRSSASLDEAEWRRETVKIVERFAELDSRVQPLIWSNNPGLTNHSVRTLEKCFESGLEIIQLEDDNQITIAGLEFLSNFDRGTNQPQIRSAYNKSFHPTLSNSYTYRNTIFPVQWGTSFNIQMFSSYQDSWESKAFDPNVVKKQISQISGISLVTRKRLEDYWSFYFRNSILSPRHGDIVMQYSTFKEGIYYKVPIGDEVIDLSSLDWRGMNQRMTFESIEEHGTRGIVRIGSGFTCTRCELRNSRIEPNLIKQIGNSVQIRLNPLKHKN